MKIRPLENADLPEVARQYETLWRSGTAHHPAGLEQAFRQLFLEAPVAARDMPSLVLESEKGIEGFLGIQARSFTLGNQPRRLASCGPLFVSPAMRHRAAGVFMLKQALEGPQDLSTSDGANDEARQVWERLGGTTAIAQSLQWTAPLQPARATLRQLAARYGALPTLAARLAEPLAGLADRLTRKRWLAPFNKAASAAPTVEPLTAEHMSDMTTQFDVGTRLRPVYTEDVANWLLRQMAGFTCRGEFIAQAVSRNGQPIGWFLAYFGRDHLLDVIQIYTRSNEVPHVLGAVFREGLERSALAVRGRLEGRLGTALIPYRCTYSYGTLMLVHGETEVLDPLLSLDAAISRAEGEWWMGLREQTYD